MIEFPPINATTPPLCHPASLSQEAKALGPDHAVLNSMQETLAATYVTLTAMTAASRAAFSENDAKNAVAVQNAKRAGGYPPGSYMGPDGRIMMPLEAPAALSLNDAVHNAFERNIKPKLAATMTLCETRVTALEKDIAAAVTDKLASTPAGLHYVDKVHNHLQSMASPGERSAWTMTKIKELNLRAVSAVINSEPEWSGIDPKMIGVLRQQAEKAFNPPMVTELAQCRAMAAKLKTITAQIGDHVVKNTVAIRKNQEVSLRSLNALRALGKAG